MVGMLLELSLVVACVYDEWIHCRLCLHVLRLFLCHEARAARIHQRYHLLHVHVHHLLPILPSYWLAPLPYSKN